MRHRRDATVRDFDNPLTMMADLGGLRSTDEVVVLGASWARVSTRSELASFVRDPVPATPPASTPQEWILRALRTPAAKVAAGVVVSVGMAALGFKALQALTDYDFETVEYPAWFRRALIDAHVRDHGCVCLRCGKRRRRADLHVDHIIPLSKGGRTSTHNAQVLCKTCNLAKGNRHTTWEGFRGRSE